MKVLVDTNLCVFAMKGNERVLERLLAHAPSAIGISIVTEAELRLGAEKSARRADTLSRLEAFLAPLNRLAFGHEDSLAYARVRADLERKGTPIGPLDTMIASQAVARGLVLATNNVREFRRVRGLDLEDWTRG